jgi:hypothetical protein
MDPRITITSLIEDQACETGARRPAALAALATEHVVHRPIVMSSAREASLHRHRRPDRAAIDDAGLGNT